MLNIKVKENQFVPMTVTNKDHRDSFKFSNTHIMQKMLTGAAATNPSQSNGSISTRNLSLAQLHHNKEAAAQNQLNLQRFHLRSNGNYSSNHDYSRPATAGYRMNSSLNKAEIVKQLNVSRERLNTLLQGGVRPVAKKQ